MFKFLVMVMIFKGKTAFIFLKNSGKTKSDEALAVFDLEKQSWRSFRFDSVKEINFNMIGK